MGAAGKDAELVASILFQSVSESLSYTLTGLSLCACAFVLWLGLFQPSLLR